MATNYIEALNVAEAAILFYSHHYKVLRCKIIDKEDNSVICCKLINNCIETTFTIGRDLQDFFIELYQESVLVGVFSYTYDDVESVVGSADSKQASGKRKKYLKFKKQNDCCLLYFTIPAKDVVCNSDFETSEAYIYQDFVRNVANKVYMKIETKAIERIKKMERLKLEDKRLSLTQMPSYNKQAHQKEKNSCFLKHKRGLYRQNRRNAENTEEAKNAEAACRQFPEASRSWMCSGLQKKVLCEQVKFHLEKKQQHRLRKMKQKVQKLFKKKTGFSQEPAVISEMIMSRDDMRLISQNVSFPKRLNSQPSQEKGIQEHGFIKLNSQAQNRNQLNQMTFVNSFYTHKSKNKKKPVTHNRSCITATDTFLRLPENKENNFGLSNSFSRSLFKRSLMSATKKVVAL